jgi:hypothetical protein
MQYAPTTNLAINRATYAHAYGLIHRAQDGDASTALLNKAAAATTCKAMIALVHADDPTYPKPNGGNVAKSINRRQIERARLDALLNVLADVSLYHPLGMTESAVELTLRKELYEVTDDDRAWATDRSIRP